MRIVYDGVIFSHQTAGGINRYFENLIRRLPQHFTPILIAANQHAVNYPTHPQLKIHRFELPRWTRHCHSIARIFQRRALRRVVESPPADLLHPTYYSLLSGQALARCRLPRVLTVHDLIHERFAALLDPQGEWAASKRRAIAAADAIICVSQHTKSDLLDIYAPPESKITVIPHASDLRWDPSQTPSPALERPYFLYVGSRASYKNFDRLLIALRNTQGRHSDVWLYVVGTPFVAGEQARLAELGVADRVRHFGYATDAELASLYHGSVALVYPSLYEGFGIPVLEAMACGTAVIASNCTSIPEVAGDAAILFEPHSTEDLTSALTQLLESPAQRAALIQRGLARAEQFHWDHTARQTLAVYHSVAGRPAARAA